MLVMPAVKNGDAAPAGQRPNARSKANQPHMDSPAWTGGRSRNNHDEKPRKPREASMAWGGRKPGAELRCQNQFETMIQHFASPPRHVSAQIVHELTGSIFAR